MSVLYATESMRLTTRLLELASWLMIRRAPKEGEITAEEARAKRERVKLRAPGRPSHVKGFADLPAGLRDLIEASYALNDRIVQLDRAMQVVVGDTDGRRKSGGCAGDPHRGGVCRPAPPRRGARGVFSDSAIRPRDPHGSRSFAFEYRDRERSAAEALGHDTALRTCPRTSS